VCHSGLTAGRDRARAIMELFRELNRAGTIVQVTHSEDNARYGNRVIRLCDGWLVT
jgi:putative ABC transport system ATP-binding protein